MARLALITERFPYAGVDSAFLRLEVEALSCDHSIVILPTSWSNQGVFALPSNVMLDAALCDIPARPGLLELSRGANATLVKEAGRRKRHLARRPRFATLLVRSARVEFTRRRFAEWLSRDSSIDLVYSWWSTAPALGASLALEGSGIPMVTRAHGYDLFPEQDRLGFIPFQRQLLERVDRMFSVSQAGAEYLCGAYPDLAGKVEISYLGTEVPSGLAPSSSDDRLRIVTCSSVVPVKRLDRMVDAVHLMRGSGLDVEWTHIGGGHGLESLKRQCESLGTVVRFTGELPAGMVTSWLTQHPVDLFCNVSESEGLPVTLMEAASCGIPLLAADVGGNREIVDATVGSLLVPEPSFYDIAEAVRAFAGLDALQRTALREASRLRWEEQFQAESNYPAFSQRLLDLAGAR